MTMDLKKKDLIKTYSNFITHSEILFRIGRDPHYKRSFRIYSLDRLQRMKPALPERTFLEICAMIVKHREDLENILPYYGNSSYLNSLRRLENILQYCTNELLLNSHPVPFNQLIN